MATGNWLDMVRYLTHPADKQTDLWKRDFDTTPHFI